MNMYITIGQSIQSLQQYCLISHPINTVMQRQENPEKLQNNPEKQQNNPFHNQFSEETLNDQIGWHQSNHPSVEGNYFQHLLNDMPFTSLKKTFDEVNTVSLKLENKLVQGGVKVGKDRGNIHDIIKIKEEISAKRKSFNSDLHNFNLALDIENASRLSHTKSDNKFNIRRRAKTQVSSEEIRKILDKRQVSRERLQSWKKKTEEVRHIRQRIQSEKRLKTQKVEAGHQRKLIQQSEERKLTKMEAIKVKLLQINKRRTQRSELLKRSHTERSHTLPHYLAMSRKFNQSEKVREYKKTEIMKLMRKKMEKSYDSQHIRQHQKLYTDLINSRVIKKRVKSQSLERCQSNLDSRFKVIGRNLDQIQKERERAVRRAIFQSRQRLIPVKPSLKKMIEAEMNKDKAANPYKYTFLSQKALDDLCIFSEFQDFQVPEFHGKELGNQYFEEMKIKFNSSRANSKHTSRKVATVQAESRVSYQNYLKDIKVKRPRKITEIEKIIHENGNKSKAIDQLRKESVKHENRVMKKIFQLQKVENYRESVEKEQEIDVQYIKSVKARVAVLELQ